MAYADFNINVTCTDEEAVKIKKETGLDIQHEIRKRIEEALKSINLQLAGAAYEITDLDVLLQEAQAIGDEIVEIPEIKTGTQTEPSTTTEENEN